MTTTISIFDTTLRDGEQSPGATMTIDEKIEMAVQLEKLGVNAIEAGFPESSPGDTQAVKEIAQTVKNIITTGLCRLTKPSIDKNWEAISFARLPRIHTFIATSDIHMQEKLHMTRNEVIKSISDNVAYACSLRQEVQFSAEDATRSDINFLIQALQAAIEAGAKIINIPDTVGYALPDEYGNLIKRIIDTLGHDDVIYSTHCHNDLGHAVSNTIAAISSGARQAEVTLNGIGERAGNASLEQLVMTLNVRRDILSYTTSIDTKQIYPSCRKLSRIINQGVPRNQPIVGANAFAHEAGIHQHGVIADPSTYEIMDPETIGIKGNTLVPGKHSGRHVFRKILEDFGHNPSDEQIDMVSDITKTLADQKRFIHPEDVEMIFIDLVRQIPDVYKIIDLNLMTGLHITPTAAVRMEVGGVTQEVCTDFGNGAIDAVFRAIHQALRIHTALDSFTIRAITGGTDAIGEVKVEITNNGAKAIGLGAHVDIIIASAKAIVDALNRLAKKKQSISL